MKAEKEVMERLENYLSRDISAQDLALRLRRIKLEVVRLILNTTEDNYNKDWITDGLYFIDCISEILDPYLEKEL